MTAILILLKLCIVASWGLTIAMVVKFRKENTEVQMGFDMLSSIDICLGMLLSVIGLCASTDPSAYVFTLIIMTLALAIVNFQRYRLLIAAKDNVLLWGKSRAYKDLKDVYPKVVFLVVKTKKDEQIQVYVPLTKQEITQKLYDKVKNKKK